MRWWGCDDLCRSFVDVSSKQLGGRGRVDGVEVSVLRLESRGVGWDRVGWDGGLGVSSPVGEA